MNLAAHGALERFVDQALSVNRALAFEPNRDDDSPEVAPAISGANMPHVQVALVDDLDMNGSQAFTQFGFDTRSTIRRVGHENQRIAVEPIRRS